MDAETMVGSLISRAHLPSALPPSSRGHSSVVIISFCCKFLTWNRSEGYQGRIMGGTWEGQIDDTTWKEHSFCIMLKASSAEQLVCLKKQMVGEDVEFLTIRANKKICRVLIYFSIVDFYLKTSCYFWPSLFWFLVLYDSNLFEQKEYILVLYKTKLFLQKTDIYFAEFCH